MHGAHKSRAYTKKIRRIFRTLKPNVFQRIFFTVGETTKMRRKGKIFCYSGSVIQMIITHKKEGNIYIPSTPKPSYL